MNCISQVQDLAVASPATVSRCGMVYIDPDELKWMPYVQTWISGLGAKVVHILSLFRQLLKLQNAILTMLEACHIAASKAVLHVYISTFYLTGGPTGQC